MTCINKFENVFLGAEASATLAPLGSHMNPRKIQASFNSPPHPKAKDPRPHITLQINNKNFCMVGDRIIVFNKHTPEELFILDLSPSLKTLCKRAVIQYDLEQSELPHNIRWELAAMTKRKKKKKKKELAAGAIIGQCEKGAFSS